MKFRYLLFSSFFLFLLISFEIFSQSFKTGEIDIRLNNYGRVRVYKDFGSGVIQIDRSSFLAGVNSNYVFQYKLSAESEEPMLNVTTPLLSDYEIYGSINNTYDITGGSPDFLVKHNVYGWNNGGYALVKFTVINRESQVLNTVLGMEIIAQIDASYGLETIEYLKDSQIIALYRLPTSTHVGYKMVSHNMSTLKVFEWYDLYYESNPDMYAWLTYGQIDTLYDSGGDGAVSIFSKDAVDIVPGDSAIFWVAISIGDDKSEMVANMALAEEKYNLVTAVDEIDFDVPTAYELSQNYPNPFNPATKISFGLPERSNVVLKVFNLIGEEVALITRGSYEAGTYYFDFDASELPSGIYIYSLQTDNSTISKKMTLMK